MLHQNSPAKRGREENLEERGPAEKMIGLQTEGDENRDDPVDASAPLSNDPSTSRDSPKTTAEQNEGTQNKVLLFTVNDARYPISVDVLQKICASKGANVVKIVILRKREVQAMVEFETLEDAKSAKELLDGQQIYSGCCTLKIDWGRSPSLNVLRNDNSSWDYTRETGEKDKDTGAKGQPLLPLPTQFASGPSHVADRNGQTQRQNMPLCGPAPGMQHYQQPPVAPAAGNDNGSNSMLQQGSVLMVYGLNKEKMNCQRIFNLFCLYGNVVRVKFLKSKDGVAMVQFGDNASCERAIKNINGCFVFGHKMLIGYSKQAFIQDVPDPVVLSDGSVSFVDFMGSQNNRFTTPEATAKNRIQSASKVLYFFNAPPAINEDDFTKVFTDCNVKAPTKIKIFPSKTQRSSTGLLEWDNKAESVEAITAANHTQIPNPNGQNPYVVKFCFSDAPIKG